jgi:PHD/YefM family antitoxin component YafN of YafNO toxin-antitoxin module
MDPERDRWMRSAEAQEKFRKLLDDAEDGKHTYILRYDKPAAVLVPVDWYEQVRAFQESGRAADSPGPRLAAAADPLENVVKRLAGLPREGGPR